MSRGPGKLRFSVLSCTGEDPDYPARELLYHSPQTRGWQCPRFCKFPQEITLQLESPSQIQQIQILSHEYKIATKLELYVGNDSGRAPMRRLGHLSFDSNERSGHQARELKSVHVNTTATVFKLVVQRCHINKLNIYNQVGIVALNLIGEPLSGGAGGGVGSQRTGAPTARQPHTDLALDMGVDSKTATVIRELHAKKEAAVANEDYDEAKQLKATIDRLRSVGQKIGQLEAKKAAAVEREDYDAAKALKVDIDKLRRAADADGVAKPGGARRSNNPQDIFDRVLDVAGPPEGMMAESHPMMASSGAPRHSEGGEEPPGASVGGSPVGGSARGSYGFNPEELPGPDGVPPQGGSRVLHSRDESYGGSFAAPRYEAYDERPAMGKGAYRLDSPSVQQAMEGSPPIRAGASQARPPPGLQPPPGFPPDLPAPEPLTSADSGAAEPLAEILGEYVAMCLFSKNWQLREAGMQHLEAKLSDGSLPGQGERRDEMRSLTKVISRALKDKVANVFQTGMASMRTLVETYGKDVGHRELVSTCSDFVGILMDKSGENNARTQAAAAEGLLYLAATPGMDSVIAPQVCKPVKSQSAWKPVLARLNLLQQLLPQFGVHAGRQGHGLPLTEVMAYIGAAFGSPNASVRSTAVQCSVAVYQHVGDAMRAQLPTDMNKALRDQLETALEGADIGMERSDSGPPAAAPKPAPKKAAPSAPAPKAAPKPQNPSPPPPPVNDSVDDSAVMDDDPSVYERELAQREKDLGPEHPDVAESLSNLAILYNQQGDYDKAQPLYERALTIWERVQGPNSSDVAHTLTDLAVLHLEQGRDEVGRPLLERALEIQRQNLGDDHPDVIAILEVLESEE